MLEDVKANFKAPSTLTKTQAAIDLGLTDAKEIKFTSKEAMIERWEKELAASKSGEVAQALWEKTSFNPDVAPIACICISFYVNGTCYQSPFDLIAFNSEKDMLQEFHDCIDELCKVNGAIIHTPIFSTLLISTLLFFNFAS